jgi:hypothetical protein
MWFNSWDAHADEPAGHLDCRPRRPAPTFIAKQFLAELMPNEPSIWDTQAAVCAELGRFDEAVKWQKQYLGQKTLTAERRKDGEERLKLYQQHQPFRQKPAG